MVGCPLEGGKDGGARSRWEGFEHWVSTRAMEYHTPVTTEISWFILPLTPLLSQSPLGAWGHRFSEDAVTFCPCAWY